MQSPFPGVDPYLEEHWPDVHARLITYVCDQVASQLNSRLKARIEEQLVVSAEDEPDRPIRPDARVFESGVTERTGTPLAVLTPAVQPLIIPTPHDGTARRVEIIDRADRLVTVVELLSPGNKLGRRARDDYARKQAVLRLAGVNLVEIDLTRAGRRALVSFPIPRAYRTTFQACVYRAHGRRPQFEIYPIPLQRPVPPIRAPLRERDPDAVIDLQPLLAQAYRNGAYDDTDYTRPPVPPLSPADAAWAADLLTSSRPTTAP